MINMRTQSIREDSTEVTEKDNDSSDDELDIDDTLNISADEPFAGLGHGSAPKVLRLKSDQSEG